jgi:hypothetical protein
MKKSSVFDWHKRFKKGHDNVIDDERSGSPRSHRPDENVEKVQNLVHSDNNEAYYVEILERLREAVSRKKRPKLWPKD